MQTATLTISKEQLDAELAKYREPQTPQDVLIARAYRAMKRGRRIIDLFDTFRLTGVDELGRPKLAMARCDWQRCLWWFGQGWPRGYFSSHDGWGRHRKKPLYIPAGVLPGLKAPAVGRQWEAPIPSIPPKYRPTTPRNYWLLWEAAWNEVPVDPLLLQHLGGTLYLVLAGWDLTPVERAVLRTVVGS